MSSDDLYKMIMFPIVLIIVLYICYVMVSSFVEVTPGFGDAGWYIFGVIVTAIAMFLGFAWLKKR